MATTIYNEFLRASAAGEIALSADDIRVKLCMTDTTCGAENDGVVNLADFSDIDEFDGANYAVKALTGEAVNKDDANDRAEFDADDVTYTALGAGTRGVEGILVYKHVDGTDANDLAIAFVAFASEKLPDGSDFTLIWNAQGILQFAQAA